MRLRAICDQTLSTRRGCMHPCNGAMASLLSLLLRLTPSSTVTPWLGGRDRTRRSPHGAHTGRHACQRHAGGWTPIDLSYDSPCLLSRALKLPKRSSFSGPKISCAIRIVSSRDCAWSLRRLMFARLKQPRHTRYRLSVVQTRSPQRHPRSAVRPVTSPHCIPWAVPVVCERCCGACTCVVRVAAAARPHTTVPLPRRRYDPLERTADPLQMPQRVSPRHTHTVRLTHAPRHLLPRHASPHPSSASFP